LEILLCITDVNKQKIVSLERFGLLLKWFGPLTFKNQNIIDKIFKLASQPWFHGEVSRERLSIITTEQTEELQGPNRKDKCKHRFLVRFSESEPIEKHPFSITVFSKSNTTNYRINYDSESGMYSVSAMKKDELITVSDTDLIILMNSFFASKQSPIKIKKEGFVRSDLYCAIFSLTLPVVYAREKEEEEDSD